MANPRPIGSLNPEVIEAVFNGSTHRFVGYIDGELAGVCGIIEPPGVLEPAAIWVVTTPLIDRRKKTFVREVKRFIHIALTFHGGLYGYTEPGAPTRWLERLGFAFSEAEDGLRRFELWQQPQHR